MKICVFDTETININKPFCYNIGFIIYDTDIDKKLYSADYVVKQIWNNKPLFNTAYYADKRNLYISKMRGKKTVLEYWGNIMRKMQRLFNIYNVECAFAYNSPFDDRVFTFNCDWYKSINPFDTIPIFDIRGYAHTFIANTESYKNFCDTYSLYTENGNYSTTAESLYKYITGNVDFSEEHTALADSEIELDILLQCVEEGATLSVNYKPLNSIVKPQNKTLTIYKDKELFMQAHYNKISINKDKTIIKISE